METKKRYVWLTWLLSLTVFLSSFLLFSIQPLIIRYLLPYFGGSASIWALVMCFFIVLLCVGYAMVYVLGRYVTTTRMYQWYALFFFVAMIVVGIQKIQWGVPILPSANVLFFMVQSEFLRMFLVLLLATGLPYLVLSMSISALQHGLERYTHTIASFHLYRWSNVGALLALLSYSVIIQPLISLHLQAVLWGGLFLLYGVLMMGSLYWFYRTPLTIYEERRGQRKLFVPDGLSVPFGWFGLPLVSTAIMIASTNILGQSTGSFSFLLLLPLVIYLLSFVVTFREKELVSYHVSMILSALGAVIVLWRLPVFHLTSLLHQGFWVAVFLFIMFSALHRSLFLRRPTQTGRLPFFYLVSSLGSAVGAVCVSVISPYLFTDYVEWYILLFLLLVFVVYWGRTFLQIKQLVSEREWFAVSVSLILLLTLGAFYAGLDGDSIHKERNFYGTLSVGYADIEKQSARYFMSGKTVHGYQYQSEVEKFTPTAYFSLDSGIGKLLSSSAFEQKPRVFVAGLGIGTLSAYCDTFASITFAEINPAIVYVANHYFDYLAACGEKVTVMEGDARVLLTESDSVYDILVLDAFTDDIVPEHLLTQEAVQMYLNHLDEQGILAFNVSNRFLRFDPLMRGIGDTFGLSGVLVENTREGHSQFASRWAFFSHDEEQLLSLFANSTYLRIVDVDRSILWTDEKSSIVGLLL